MAEANVNPIEKLSELMNGFWVSQCVHVAASLDLADHVGQGGIDTDKLAAKAEVHPGALARLMRVLCSFGVFARGSDGTWEQTPMSMLLRADNESHLKDRAVVLGALAWAPWGQLGHAVRTGQPAFDHVYGVPFFEHLQKNPELAASFGRTMTSFTAMTAQAVASAHDFSGYRKLVDVGGGQGIMAGTLLAQFHDLEVTILDRPEVVVAGAPAVAPELRERCKLVEGDFFESVPAADAYVLSWILHDWDHARSIRILETCAEAMTTEAELLVVEMLVPEGDEPAFAKMFDLEMLVQTGGRERTAQEYALLMDAAGLVLDRVEATQAPHSVLVARKK